jgi:bifunctional DNase/RNase
MTAPGAAASEDPERWRLVVVAGVSMELPSAFPEILLRESISPYRELRIPVGLPEATAIAHAWRGLDTPRPLTHDMVTTMLTLHNVSIEAVRITGRRGKLFYAEIETAGPRGCHLISCRPSDAIALALRQPLPTPMLVTEELLAGEEIP